MRCFAFLILLAVSVNCAITKTTKAPKHESTDETDEVSARQMSGYCPSSKFQCGNGLCINKNLVCDGKRDCRDGSDESQLICWRRPENNKPTTTQIPSGYEIYPLINEEDDNSHHQNPSESSTALGSCPVGQFACNNGGCINQNRVCDTFDDCGDGSDESSRACGRETPIQRPPVYPSQRPPQRPVTQKPTFSCRTGEFLCLSGECISNDYVCNGRPECRDGSDEAESICPDLVKPPATTTRQPNTGSQEGQGGQGTWGSQSLTPCRVPPQPKNGRWLVHRSLCGSRGVECELPAIVRSLDPGSFLVYSCNKGFMLNGTRDVLCGPGGAWVHEPKCEQIKCDDLSTSSREAVCIWNNLAVSCEIPVPIGTTGQLQCREGFVQEVSYSEAYKNVTCMENGQWDRKPIQCVKKPKKVKLILEGDMIIKE